METSLGSALTIVGVALVVLLVVLSAMAALIYFLTGIIKDSEEPEEDALEIPVNAAADQEAFEREARKKVALIAVALARSASVRPAVSSDAGSEMSAWRQFHLGRRLNQSLRMRRSP